MATYKVIQDIEAEDKLVGPFSLRQFIYAAIAILTGFIAFKFASLSVFFIIPFTPVVALFAVLAAPFGRDQPSEIWLLAKIRFFLKPHLRIWNQDGAINLVTVTAPKQVQKQLTNNLSSQEVTSRLQALANTIDTRGWAIKNVSVNLSAGNPYIPTDFSSQRLIDLSDLPKDVPVDNLTDADDIMDLQNNPTAQHLDQMINSADKAHHAKVVASVSQPNNDQTATAHPDYWFMNNSIPSDLPKDYSDFRNTKVVAPGANATDYAPVVDEGEEQAILQDIETRRQREQDYLDAHAHIVKQPDYHDNAHLKQPTVIPNPPVTPQPNPDIINQALANKGNWSLQTQASEAKKMEKPPEDEVIVSLH